MRFSRHYTAGAAGDRPQQRHVTRPVCDSGDDSRDFTAPAGWGQAAREVFFSCRFEAQVSRPDNLLCAESAHGSMPQWLCPPWQLKTMPERWHVVESDARAIVARVAGGLTWAGWKGGYFSGEEDARVFHDELEHLLLHQIAVFEPALMRGLGLRWAYGAFEPALVPAQTIAAVQDPLEAPAGSGVDISAPGANAAQLLGKLRAREILASTGGQSSTSEYSAGGYTATLDAAHPALPQVAGWLRHARQDAAALACGRAILPRLVNDIFDACDRDSLEGFDPLKNADLQAALERARRAGVPDGLLREALLRARAGEERAVFDSAAFGIGGADSGHDNDSGHYGAGDDGIPQESRTRLLLRVPDRMAEAAITNHSWPLRCSLTGETTAALSAQVFWEGLSDSIWQAREPGLLFETTANEWGACPKSARVTAASHDGAFLFSGGTASVFATINALAFATSPALTDGRMVDAEALTHVARVMTVALDIAAGNVCRLRAPAAQQFRPLSLGLDNIGALLMGAGVAYGTPAAAALVSAITAAFSAACWSASADMAAAVAPFPAFEENRRAVINLCENARLAAHGHSSGYRNLSKPPVVFRTDLCPDPALVKAAQAAWDDVSAKIRRVGLRNAHLCAFMPAGEAEIMLGAQAPGLDPVVSLVRFEGFSGDGAEESALLYGRKLNPAVVAGLVSLGYDAHDIDSITFHVLGHGTLLDAPCINHETLKARGLSPVALDAIETAVRQCRHVSHAFSRWTLGDAFCQEKIPGFCAAGADGADILRAMGFTAAEIAAANLYCCGTGTLAGAPALKPQHAGVFVSALPEGESDAARVTPEMEIAMMAAAQPFLSGAVARTILLPQGATPDDVAALMQRAWASGLKLFRTSREKSALDAPLLFSEFSLGDENAVAGVVFAEGLLTEHDAAPSKNPVRRRAAAKDSGRKQKEKERERVRSS